jgi:hypothetical protein
LAQEKLLLLLVRFYCLIPLRILCYVNEIWCSFYVTDILPYTYEILPEILVFAYFHLLRYVVVLSLSVSWCNHWIWLQEPVLFLDSSPQHAVCPLTTWRHRFRRCNLMPMASTHTQGPWTVLWRPSRAVDHSSSTLASRCTVSGLRPMSW